MKANNEIWHNKHAFVNWFKDNFNNFTTSKIYQVGESNMMDLYINYEPVLSLKWAGDNLSSIHLIKRPLEDDPIKVYVGFESNTFINSLKGVSIDNVNPEIYSYEFDLHQRLLRSIHPLIESLIFQADDKELIIPQDYLQKNIYKCQSTKKSEENAN